jgi:hypothetical protein
MPSTIAALVVGLVILLLMVISLRWLLRKLKMRHAWAAIESERRDNKRSFGSLAIQLPDLIRQWRADPARVPSAPDLPEFPAAQWQTVVSSGAAAMMQPSQRQEVEELYVDLDRLRSCVIQVAKAAGKALGSADRAEALRTALSAAAAEMRRFQPLHTDFDATLPDPAVTKIVEA